jgi:hypothetical protein
MVTPRAPLSSLVSLALLLGGCAEEDALAPNYGGASGEPDLTSGPDVSAVDVTARDAVTADLVSSADVGPAAPPPWPARAFVATASEHLVGGPKAEGAIGDVVLETDSQRFVIEGLRPGSGYRQFGGNLVDVGLGGGASGDDLFGELWFSWNFMVFEPTEIAILSDGEDGVAHVRVSGHTASYAWAESFIRGILAPGPAPLGVVFDYRLRADKPYLELTVTTVNDGLYEVSVDYPVIYLNHGDGLALWTDDGYGLGSLMGRRDVRFFAAVGATRSYGVYLDSGINGLMSSANMELTAYAPYRLNRGESRSVVLAIAPAEGGTGGVAGVGADHFEGQAKGFVEGVVQGFDATTWVALRSPEAVLGLAPVGPNGRFRMRAPVGIWQAEAWHAGLRRSAVVDARARVMDPPPTALTLAPTGTLVVDARDAAGRWIPSQVTVTPRGGEAALPPQGERLVRAGFGDGVVLHYAVTPGARLALPAGVHDVIVSRGYLHELWRGSVTIEAGGDTTLAPTLPRAADTGGWTAGDFHVHGWWSSDSDVPYDLRARQAAASDVGLPVMTEHAYIGDVGAAAAQAGVEAWVAAVPAQEVTTFEYGHFNAFPMTWDPDAPSGGAVFEHGRAGTALFAAIRAHQPAPMLVQVNHPRRFEGPGFNYFDIVGLDAATRTVRDRTRWTEDWDLVEVFNGRCDGAGNAEAMADWIALNNAGKRAILGAGSDSHTEAAGLGHPRVWVEVDVGAVALDPQAIVAPIAGRRSFVSCGPFVRFRTEDGVGLGGLAQPGRDGEVRFAVTVEAPSWMALAEARLLMNGVVVARRAVPAGSGTRLDAVLTARPTRDAWFALEVTGAADLPRPFPADRPYALTNAIDVDVDGDGRWTPPGN